MAARRRSRGALVAALCLALALLGVVSPPTAQAEASLTLEGRGFGHGIGMSQYGARYRAEAGHSYTQILSAYYPGTTLSAGSDSATIRVRIESDSDSVTTVQNESGLRLSTSLGTVTLPTTVGGSTPTHWRIRISAGALVVEARVGGTWRSSGSSAVSQILQGRGRADFVDTDGSVRLVLGSTYREYVGAVRGWWVSGTTTLRTVVVSTMANYLPSVVASEMPSSWSTHALRAQAVAARTYALFDQDAKPSSSYYDTCDTTACQVFKGRADYTSGGTLVTTWAVATTIAATTATAGRYLSYGGAPAFTQFSASNGGYSVAGSRPYLRAAADTYDRYPAWSVTLTAATVEDAYPAIGRFTGIATVRDGRGAYGGRVTSITVQGTAGSVTVTGAQFRSTFGLRSTLFSAAVEGLGTGTRDADADGDADLISVDSDGLVRLWRGNGVPTFTSSTRLGGAWAGHDPLTVALDVSGSGYPEILAIEHSTEHLTAHPLRPDGTLGRGVPVHTGDWGYYELLIGVLDFTGNGLPGVLARGPGSSNMYYYESNGDGGLQSRRPVPGWPASAAVDAAAAVGDWDGDGAPDLIVLGASGSLWLYPGTGAGGFEPPVLLSTHPGWSHRVDLLGGADWDGDGSLDLLSIDAWGRLMINESSPSGGIMAGRQVGSGWTHDLLS